MRVAGRRRARFWQLGDPRVSTIRLYRVPDDAPDFPELHTFMQPEYDDMGQGQRYPSAGPGVFWPLVAYDNGRRPPWWRPATRYVGTPEQWLDGSDTDTDPPLVWTDGASADCRGRLPALGRACQAGCEECPAAPLAYYIDAGPDVGPVASGTVAWSGGCTWSNQCVRISGCRTGMARGWTIVPEVDTPAVAAGYVVWQGGATWSSCCQPTVST